MIRKLLMHGCPLVIAGLLLAFPTTAADTLRVRDAWIQEGPPTVPVLAGYLTLENPTGRDLRVTNITSPVAERVEIHRSEITEATATMTRIPQLLIPPRTTISFAPGGYHLMIFAVEQPPRAGTKVDLELQLSSGDKLTVQAEVRREPAEPETP